MSLFDGVELQANVMGVGVFGMDEVTLDIRGHELRLDGHAKIARVADAAEQCFAAWVIIGVYVDRGIIGGHRQPAARIGIRQDDGHAFAACLERMVITKRFARLQVFRFDMLAEGHALAEIHRLGDRQLLREDQLLINIEEDRRVHLEHVVTNVFLIGARKIEICMIGKINGRREVGFGPIFDQDFIM